MAMAFRHFILLALSIALVSAREDLVPNLAFKRSNCYRRMQVCCYRYEVKAKFCKQNLCTRVTYCARRKKKYCSRYRAIRTCKVRCFHRMRPKYECTPNQLKKEPGYVHSKEYLEYIDKPPITRYMN